MAAGCFVKGISVSTAPSARGKCKATSAPFAKGQTRLGFSSHNTTVYISLAAAAGVLQPFSEVLEARVRPAEISGFDTIPPRDQTIVARLFDPALVGDAGRAAAAAGRDRAGPGATRKREPDSPPRTDVTSDEEVGGAAAAAAAAGRLAAGREAESPADTYLRLTQEVMPGLAAKHKWCLHHDHCFQRVVLDRLFGGCWYSFLDKGKTAYKQLSPPQLVAAVGICDEMLADLTGGVLRQYNEQSLAARGKRRKLEASATAS